MLVFCDSIVRMSTAATPNIVPQTRTKTAQTKYKIVENMIFKTNLKRNDFMLNCIQIWIEFGRHEHDQCIDLM